MSLLVFPACVFGVWLLLMITLRRTPQWFFVLVVCVAGALIVAGIVDWRSHIDDHADLGTSGYFPAGLIRYAGNAMLGLVTALALAGLTALVEVSGESRRGRTADTVDR